MKKHFMHLLAFTFITCLILSCDNDDEVDTEPVDPDTEQVDPKEEDEDSTEEENEGESGELIVADPNKATESIILDNMKVHSGTPPRPETGKTGDMVDLKMNRDTIFWTEGITQRLMIKSPENTELKGFWIYVTGADSYLEATFREEESSTIIEGEEPEDIDVFYFDFDPTGWDLPSTFPIEIIPFDHDDNPVDTKEGPVVIEEPHDPSTNTGSHPIDQSYYEGSWVWIMSKDINIDFYAAPEYPFKTEGTTLGCCDGGVTSSQDPNCNNFIELSYTNYYAINREFFILVESPNTFGGRSEETTRNFDPGISDFCTLYDGYNYDKKSSHFAGTWEVDTDGHLVFTYTSRDSFVYVGSLFQPISDHFMEEVNLGGPDGGGQLRRVYEKVHLTVTTDDSRQWYD